MQHLSKSFYAVIVPKDIVNLIIMGNQLGDSWTYEEFELIETLPEGSWSIISLASEAGEDIWKMVVSVVGFGNGLKYKNYLSNEIQQHLQYKQGFYTATESGHSLLTSLNLDKETTLIIEKLK